MSSQTKLEDSILLLQNASGDAPHLREQERAARFLLDNADEAHPRLLALLRTQQASNPFAIIEILPRFGRADSVPLLADILATGPDNLRRASGAALAQHPHESAQEALIEGLDLPDGEAVIAAADGLMSRGNPAACQALMEKLSHRDPIVRYHVIQAAGHLDCLERQHVIIIAREDPDEDIRELAQELLRKKKNG